MPEVADFILSFDEAKVSFPSYDKLEHFLSCPVPVKKGERLARQVASGQPVEGIAYFLEEEADISSIVGENVSLESSDGADELVAGIKDRKRGV